MDRMIGVLLFVPVPIVLALLTRYPLGVGTSLLIAVIVIGTHRLYARPWALSRRADRCLWCASRVGNGFDVAIREPMGKSEWWACRPEHRGRLLAVFSWAESHATYLRVGILGSLVGYLLASVLSLFEVVDLSQRVLAALFQLGIALTVLPLGWLAPSHPHDPGARAVVPFPVHIQALIGTLAVIWLFRVIGVLWLVVSIWILWIELGSPQ